MRRLLRPILASSGLLLGTGCGSHGGALSAIVPASCSIAAATPWIETWFAAWDLASRELLRLPSAAAPELLFYDASCVYTTSPASARNAPIVEGPALGGEKLPWRVAAHGGTLVLPDGSERRVALLSFASATPERGPYFVMAAPSYWEQTLGPGEDAGVTGVFLHEFAHTRQFGAVGDVIGPIDAEWPYADKLDDDIVQRRFQKGAVYASAWLDERDLLYRAADAPTLDEARALAAEALAAIQRRHARWFTGRNALFSTLDGVFLSLEGVGQWTAYAWLAHPEGGRLERQAAIDKMLGRRRWWAQDEGLALFLVIDRLLPEWPALAFGEPYMSAVDLLERAVEAPATARGLDPPPILPPVSSDPPASRR